MDNTALRARVIEMNEQRVNIINQLREEIVATSGRDLNEEETAKQTRMTDDINRIKREIDALVENETRSREAEELRAAQAHIFGETREQARNIDRGTDAQLRAWINDGVIPTYQDDQGKTRNGLVIDIRGAQKEKELLRQGASPEEIRALAWDTGSSASLVPSTLARTLYQYMEASIGIFRAPTTKFTTTTGETMWFPKLAAHSIATQVSGQGTALAGTDPSFGRLTMDAFKYGELVRVSSEFLNDSAIDISSFLGRDIGRALGRKIGADLVVGTGSGQPNGIMTAQSGSGTIATGGSLLTPTVEKLIDLKYSVIDEYRNDPSCSWLMNDSTAGTLSKLRDGAGGTIGAFLWRPSLTQGVQMGAPDMFLDKPVYTDPNVAAQASNAKTVAFGAMSAYYVRQVGNPVIESDASRFFDTDEVAFRGKWRIDGDCIDNTTGSTVGAINVIKQNV